MKLKDVVKAEKQCAKLRDRLNGMDNPTLRLQCKNSLGKIEKALSAERIKLQGAEQ